MSEFTKGPDPQILILTALCSSSERCIFPPITCQEITHKQWQQLLGVWVAESRLTLRWQKVSCVRSGYQGFQSCALSVSRSPFAVRGPGSAAGHQDGPFLWPAAQWQTGTQLNTPVSALLSWPWSSAHHGTKSKSACQKCRFRLCS